MPRYVSKIHRRKYAKNLAVLLILLSLCGILYVLTLVRTGLY